MPDFPKAPELLRIFRDEAVANSQSLTVNAVDRDGSDANIHAAATAAMGEEVIGQLAGVEEGVWLDSAFGEKLDRWAWDRYGELRKQAAPAFAFLHFSTTVGAPASFTIPAGTRCATAGGQEFLTVVTTPFAMGSVGPLQVLARSTLAGLDQNVGSETIQNIVSQISGAPDDLAVTNPQAAGGGAPVESDSDFKARLRLFFPTARRGTKTAVRAGALAVPGVLRATVVEALTGSGFPARAATLVIADSFTDALVRQGVAVPAYDAKSEALAVVVAAELEEFRACGIPVRVIVAQVRLVSVVLRLRFRADVTNTDIVALAARTVVVQLINALNPGETFDPSAARTALGAVSGLDVVGDEIASPVGAIVPTSPYQVLRSAMTLVTTDSQATLQQQALNV